MQDSQKSYYVGRREKELSTESYRSKVNAYLLHYWQGYNGIMVNSNDTKYTDSSMGSTPGQGHSIREKHWEFVFTTCSIKGFRYTYIKCFNASIFDVKLWEICQILAPHRLLRTLGGGASASFLTHSLMLMNWPGPSQSLLPIVAHGPSISLAKRDFARDFAELGAAF